MKKLLEERKGKIQAALERFNWLMKNEGLLAIAQTLGVIHQSSNEINKIKCLLSLFPFIAMTDSAL